LSRRGRRETVSWQWNRSGFIAALLACIVTGCSTVTVPPVPRELPTRQWNPGELVDALRQRDQQFHSLRALARLDYAGPDGKSSFQEAILVQRPDQLRLETLSFLGAIMIVTVNGREILGYLPREGTFLRGRSTTDNLRRLTKIPLPLELDEITALLLGLPPVNTRAAALQTGNAVTFSTSDGGQDIVSFETNEAVPSRWERRDADGATAINVTFSDYAATAAGLFPSRIAIESAAQKRQLQIDYQEPELNTTLGAELFTQQKPASVKELPIEALGE
jgi:Domain of unknown function (DUF4292)